MTKVSYILKKTADVAQDKQMLIGDYPTKQITTVTIEMPNILGDQSEEESYEITVRRVYNNSD